jgi:hypothetical protein
LGPELGLEYLHLALAGFCFGFELTLYAFEFSPQIGGDGVCSSFRRRAVAGPASTITLPVPTADGTEPLRSAGRFEALSTFFAILDSSPKFITSKSGFDMTGRGQSSR